MFTLLFNDITGMIGIYILMLMKFFIRNKFWFKNSHLQIHYKSSSYLLGSNWSPCYYHASFGHDHQSNIFKQNYIIFYPKLPNSHCIWDKWKFLKVVSKTSQSPIYSCNLILYHCICIHCVSAKWSSMCSALLPRIFLHVCSHLSLCLPDQLLGILLLSA